MTIEELFTEEYKKLKEENKKLTYQITLLQNTLTNVTDRKLELESLIRSLKPVIDDNAYSHTKYIYFSNNYIPENNDYYKDALFFVKDIEKKEDKK